MKNIIRSVLIILVILVTNNTIYAQTIDAGYRGRQHEKELIITEKCDANCSVTIKGTTDGNVEVPKDQMKYFRINDRNCSWTCCNSPQNSRLRPGVILAQRIGNNMNFCNYSAP
jgi:hypothetical protein